MNLKRIVSLYTASFAIAVLAACSGGGAGSVAPPSLTTQATVSSILPEATLMTESVSRNSSGEFSDRYLHTVGNTLVTASGKNVNLRGINLGGWLVTEGWMCGMTNDHGRYAQEELESRFGMQKAAVLMQRWRDHWITTADLDQIKNWGFNSVRVPFGYRNFQTADGTWIRDARGNIDFSRLDWIVEQAARRGMYVLPDLHIWQSEEQDYSAISESTPAGATARAQAARLWTAIAQHFAGNGAIAAFDVINEPTGSAGDAVQQALVSAVRAGDPKRVVLVENLYYRNTASEFTNAIYSTHYPPTDTAGLANYNAQFSDHAVPIVYGEIKAGEDTAEGASSLTLGLDRAGIGWMPWTYKGENVGGWALFDYYSGLGVDVANDSFLKIYAAWGEPLVQWQRRGAPTNSFIETGLLTGYQQGIRAGGAGL